MKGYKIFNQDMTCLGFKYQIGETYEHKGEIGVCNAGFHFCKEMQDVYNYYAFDYKNPVCEIEAMGEILTEGDKNTTDKIKIVRELSLEEKIICINFMCQANEGSWNEGSWNLSSHCVGFFNYNSFLGTMDNCCCFNAKTGLSLGAFVRKYINILQEIKLGNYSNVSKLPGYTRKKWELIKNYV